MTAAPELGPDLLAAQMAELLDELDDELAAGGELGPDGDELQDLDLNGCNDFEVTP